MNVIQFHIYDRAVYLNVYYKCFSDMWLAVPLLRCDINVKLYNTSHHYKLDTPSNERENFKY